MAAPGMKFTLDASHLNCGICLRTMYKPVSVVPCLHKFCHLCVQRWWSTQDSCPTCRKAISEVTADPFAANIIEQFIRDFPEQQLSLEERQEADGQEEHYIKIREERLDPKMPERDDVTARNILQDAQEAMYNLEEQVNGLLLNDSLELYLEENDIYIDEYDLNDFL